MDLRSIWFVVLPAYTALLSLQLFLVKCSFMHLIFQINKMLHKTTYLLPFPPSGLHNVNRFDASDIHFCPFPFSVFFLGGGGCEGWKTQVHRMFSSIAFVVLPKSRLLLQCMKSLVMNRLLENVKSEHWHMQGYSWTWEYPRAIWEAIILSFGSLFLLYCYSSKHCQHVWLSKEKGHCMKRQGRA